MKGAIRRLLTIVTETALESVLVKDLQRLGVQGYTITDARGRGSRGARTAAWSESSNIRVEIVCDAATAEAAAAHLQTPYYENCAMILFMAMWPFCDRRNSDGDSVAAGRRHHGIGIRLGHHAPCGGDPRTAAGAARG